MPTSASRSTERSSAALRDSPWCSRTDSPSWRPIVSTGLSDVIGSWNTIVIRLPRIVRIVASSAPIRLRPSNHASPSTRPGGWRTRPISAITPTLLPLPDSPTIATVSPAATS